LIASFGVATGRFLAASVGPTRTEADFACHNEEVIATDPKASWIFIVDQLNIHKSEALVRLVAQHCGLKQELGVKGKLCIPTKIGSWPLLVIKKMGRAGAFPASPALPGHTSAASAF
jgi:hypothetical protein